MMSRDARMRVLTILMVTILYSFRNLPDLTRQVINTYTVHTASHHTFYRTKWSSSKCPQSAEITFVTLFSELCTLRSAARDNRNKGVLNERSGVS